MPADPSRSELNELDEAVLGLRELCDHMVGAHGRSLAGRYDSYLVVTEMLPRSAFW